MLRLVIISALMFTLSSCVTLLGGLAAFATHEIVHKVGEFFEEEAEAAADTAKDGATAVIEDFEKNRQRIKSK